MSGFGYGAPMSSLGRSIAAYAPNFPPPVDDPNKYITGGWAGFARLPIPSSTVTSGAPYVTRKPRSALRYLYTHGAQRQSWFPFRATGQCESSKFQPFLAGMVNATFNEGLYEAGYPQNLGISVKVPTVPNDMLNGSTGPAMSPAYYQRRTIFTRRPYSTVKSIPAKPALS